MEPAVNMAVAVDFVVVAVGSNVATTLSSSAEDG